MDIKKTIHKLATDQKITEYEFMALLGAVLKEKSKIKEKAINKYLLN